MKKIAKKNTVKNTVKGKTISLPKNKKAQKIKAFEALRSPVKKVETARLLNANQIKTSLKDLAGWQPTNGNKMIYREFILRDFVAAVDLVSRIARIAEEEKHHPDIHLTQYRNLRVGMTTHEVNGLSNSDFAVASKINALPMDFKRK